MGRMEQRGDSGTANRSAQIRAASCFLAHSAAAPCRGSPWLLVQSLLGTAHPQPRGSRQLGGDGKDLLQARKSLLSPPAGPQWAATMLASPAPLPSPGVTRGRPGQEPQGRGTEGGCGRAIRKPAPLWFLQPGERPAAGQAPAHSCDVGVAVPAWTPGFVSNSSSLRNAAFPCEGKSLALSWRGFGSAAQHPRTGVWQEHRLRAAPAHRGPASAASLSPRTPGGPGRGRCPAQHQHTCPSCAPLSPAVSSHGGWDVTSGECSVSRMALARAAVGYEELPALLGLCCAAG